MHRDVAVILVVCVAVLWGVAVVCVVVILDVAVVCVIVLVYTAVVCVVRMGVLGMVIARIGVNMIRHGYSFGL